MSKGQSAGLFNDSLTPSPMDIPSLQVKKKITCTLNILYLSSKTRI